MYMYIDIEFLLKSYEINKSKWLDTLQTSMFIINARNICLDIFSTFLINAYTM